MYNSNMELKTSEHLLYFMRKNLRLSRYDLRFVTNLETIISDDNRITTNQVALLHKIIPTYTKQFVALDINPDDLVLLPWKTNVVESNTEYVDTFITVVNDEIHCKTPYNKNFIQAISKSELSTFRWSLENKVYVGSLGASNMRFIIELTARHFNNIHHCPITATLLAGIDEYRSATHWDPCLMSVNGMLLVSSINSSLYDAISHIKLNTESNTLAELATYGIMIDDSVIDLCKSPNAKFAAMFSPIVEVDDLSDIVLALIELKCDCVYLSGGHSLHPSKVTLRQKLIRANIWCETVGDIAMLSDARTFKFPVVIRFRRVSDSQYEPHAVSKVIQIVDSRPITIR